MKKLRLGTRGSALAQAQASWVADQLREIRPELEVELVTIVTSGDRFSLEAKKGAVSKDAPNLKAMFVKEIERALLDSKIELAVHSAKDLPAQLLEGLLIGAYPLREAPWDVFVGRQGAKLADLPAGSVVGTASLRRRIQISQAYPKLKFKTLRGNVDTRLAALASGDVDGVLLAAAGLKRLGKDSVPQEILTLDIIVPSPGQGALAIEVRGDRDEVRDIVAGLDDHATRLEVELERKFMREMGGGCSTPLGAIARSRPDGVELTVFWSDEDGGNAIRFSGRSGKRPEELSSLAEGLRGRIRDGQ